ncbi:SDR family NAD(P)-dependent oxidoreductase [Kitasatospora sp. NPDC052896]|uniref:SDR family NAD(P)-dependent oxidoreductase n=1 Tax=Kitasatospora sp. NPDC052896 TaxID=3364061 RepID=UPI0037C667D5
MCAHTQNAGEEPRMSTNKVVLITGTSSGIGLATAIAAARAGFRTVATLRDPARAGALREAAAEAGVELDVRALDVTDAASVASCVEGVLADHGRLDAVVNNAGAGHVGTIENGTVEDVRQVMEVNFFGVVQVTKAALPHLREVGGRVVTVSSVGGVIGQPFNEAYCAAKFAVEGFLESLAPVAGAVGVGVHVVEPGAVASEFVSNVGIDQERAVADAGPYGPALAGYLARTNEAFANAAQSPAEAAEVVLAALTEPRPAFRLQTSAAARGFAGVKLSDLDGSAVQRLTGAWIA